MVREAPDLERRAVLLRAALAVAALAMDALPAVAVAAGMRTFDIVLKGGKVVGQKSARVARGDTVVLRWSSDRKVDLHLHGYDVTTTVMPGTPAEMKVYARATGRFPIEIHGEGGSGGGHGHRNVFHLEVHPD